MPSNKQSSPDEASIILAGATGDLGGRIARELLQRGAKVRAIVRPGSADKKVEALRKLGVSIVEADFRSIPDLTQACSGGTCVVSALSGLRDVIVESQSALLQAAVEVGVPRFIPSDFAIDFSRLPGGDNRNLDFRREFSQLLDQAPIAATSVLNGMFADLLTGEAPFVLFRFKRVVYWEDADQPLDFTTIDNTAAFTAAAALDSNTPRYLRVAGEVLSARGLKEAASQATGKEFRLLRAGGLGRLNTLIKITRAIMPKNEEVFPPWQGMQYMRDMFDGRGKLEPLDNDRYPDIRWTPVREVLSASQQEKKD
jgi:uncharacterized protein YbjT (DUF2867 family)